MPFVRRLNKTLAALRRRWHGFWLVGRWAALALMSIVGWLLLASPPALAHEFKVGILLAPAAEGATAEAAFMDGFRLAVDQSPDVSHPPGEDAGDHLGAVDVEVIVVEGVAEPDAARRAALDLIERQGVVIIVADVPAAVLEAVFGPVTELETLLIATSGMNGASFPATPHFFAMGEQGGLSGRFLQTDEAFTATFREAYGRAPSTAAARGYLAARLIDIAVETIGGDFANQQALHEALLGASQTLVASGPDDAPAQVEEPPSVTASPTPVAESNQAAADSTTSPTATVEASRTSAVSGERGEADEEAIPTPVAQSASVSLGWIVAAGVVLISVAVGATLAYWRRS